MTILSGIDPAVGGSVGAGDVEHRRSLARESLFDCGSHRCRFVAASRVRTVAPRGRDEIDGRVEPHRFEVVFVPRPSQEFARIVLADPGVIVVETTMVTSTAYRAAG